MIKRIVMLGMVLMLAACGGGGGEGDSAGYIYTPDPYIPPTPTVSYISWSGSAIGTYVVDATSDNVQFRTDNRAMAFGASFYTNFTVDTSANLFLDGTKIGTVKSILSSTGSTIAGMVCNNGSMVDVYGSGSNLTIQCPSSVFPTYPSTVITPPTSSSSKPVANAGTDIVGFGTATLDGSASTNSRNAILTYLWTLTAKPAGSTATITNPTTVNPTIVPDLNGVYTVSLVVNDGVESSLPDIKTIKKITAGYFTLGSSTSSVTAMQGTPTQIPSYDTSTWYYGSSTVTFNSASGGVIAYNNLGSNLKVMLVAGNNTTGATKIALGVTTDDVIKIQGTPTQIPSYDTSTWYYGSSTVAFTSGKVSAWNNLGGNLKL